MSDTTITVQQAVSAEISLSISVKVHDFQSVSGLRPCTEEAVCKAFYPESLEALLAAVIAQELPLVAAKLVRSQADALEISLNNKR